MGAMKYDESMNEKAYKLALLGMTNAQMASFFDITESAFCSWLKKYPKFGWAVAKGRMQADAEVAFSLFKAATGYEYEDEQVVMVDKQPMKIKVKKTKAPSVSAAIFWLKNRTRGMSQAWQDISKKEVEVKGVKQIAEMDLDLSKFSEEELDILMKAGVKVNGIEKNKEAEKLEYSGPDSE